MRLTAVERRWIQGLLDEILPRGSHPRLPLSASEAGVVDFLDDHLTYMPLRTRVGLRLALDAISLATRLHPLGRRAALDALSESRLYPLREIVTLVKSVVCMGYFTHRGVRDEIGLDLTLAASARR